MKFFAPLPLLVFLAFLAGTVSARAQMPDWKFFRDREGNRYYIDQNGKIRTSGKPEFIYRAVSADGIDYYLNQGIELIERHYPLEGLVILKSIMALPPDNGRVYRAQKEASRKINHLKKREGERFDRMNDSAFLLLLKEGDAVSVINDRMMYSLKVGGDIRVLKNRKRAAPDYFYTGLLFGVGPAQKEGDWEGFDFLLAVDGERFRGEVKSVEDLEEKWRSSLREVTFKRTLVLRDERRVIYSYTSGGDPLYSGYEGILVNGRFGYMVRTITPGPDFPRHEKAMKRIVENFRFVVQK